MTATNSKTTPDPILTDEFYRLFGAETADAVRFAFQQWRDQSPFFPAISDVRKLIKRWHRDKRETAEAEKQRAEREAIEAARREGKLVDFADLQKQLQGVMAAQPEPEHVKRQRQFHLGMERASLAVSTMHMSEEEIRSRRKREVAEIDEYSQHSDNEFA